MDKKRSHEEVPAATAPSHSNDFFRDQVALSETRPGRDPYLIGSAVG